MTKDEFTRKLARLNQIMNELIYGLMQTGMTYRQAEEEVFTMLKRMRVFLANPTPCSPVMVPPSLTA